MEVNIARNQRLLKVCFMVELCCIYWKYTGDNGCCNGGLAFQQCRLFSKLYAMAYISELIEFVGSVLCSASKGFCPVIIFDLDFKF